MFRYEIYIDPLNYVAVLNDSNAGIVWELDDNGVIFRKRLDGKFSFNRSGNEPLYDKLMSLTFCEECILTCYNDSGQVIQGSFRKKALTISEDKCLINLKFDRVDEYGCLDGIADKEVNILQYNINHPIPVYTAKLNYGKTYQFYTCVGSQSYPGSYFDPLYGWIGLGEDHGAYDTIDCVGSDEWKPYQNTYVLTSVYADHGVNTFSITTIWVREIKHIERLGELQSDDIYGYVWDHLEIVDDKGYDIFVKAATVSVMREPDPILSINDPYIVTAVIANAYSTAVLDRCRKLNDVISLLVSPCFDSWESEFLKSTTNPISSVNLSNIMISQKSDCIFIKDPDTGKYYETTDPATKGILTFKTLMSYLRDMFNVYWAIDSNGDLRIEHKYYWDNNQSYLNYPNYSNTVDIDLPVIYPYSLYGTNEYTFESNIPIRETFSFMEAWNVDFIGADIDYSNCVKTGDNLDHPVSIFTTDIDPVLLSAYASKEGFCLYQCESVANIDSQYEVIVEEGKMSNSNIANAHLSWANLHDAYWKYDRYLPSGIMNGKETEFDVRPLKYQIPISFPYCVADFDPQRLIRTYLGDGAVKTAKFSFKTNWITVELQYIDTI